MKKGGGWESTTTIGPSKSVLVYALHSLEHIVGLARFRVFEPKLLLLYILFIYFYIFIILYILLLLFSFLDPDRDTGHAPSGSM